MRNQQLLAILLALFGSTVGQFGGHGGGHGGYHGGYGGIGDDYGYSGGHGGFGHGGHGYAKALPVIPKVAVAKAVDYYSEPKYSYSYGVSDAYTGDSKSAHETRDGGVTKGQYQVLQPDGVLRTVNYVADPIHGFQATVHNSAPAVHAVAKTAAVPVAPVLAKGYGGHGGFGLGHGGGHHGGGGFDGGYGGHGLATPVVKAIAPVYSGGHGGGYGGYDSGYHNQIQRVSHSSGVTHYGGGLAIPVHGGGGGIGGHHSAGYDY